MRGGASLPSTSIRCAFPYHVRLESSDGGGEEAAALSPWRCLRTEPTWMRDNYELFKDLTLGDLMLVYTHDAAAYK